jgi:hypothetical protein
LKSTIGARATLRGLIPEEDANFQWVREQLHFSDSDAEYAYYQVREAGNTGVLRAVPH